VDIGDANRATMGNPSINCYRDRDERWFWIVGLEGERHWPPLARAVGHPEWISDPRFASLSDRAKNAATLIGLLDEIFATRSREEWGETFDAEQDMWWAPVQSIDEVIADPQVHAAGGIVQVPDGPSTTPFPATPADFDGSPWSPTSMAPEQGQHTDEVLRELGRDDEAIVGLRERGVVA
jgi:crotonobetainyl-CoA:carnitine CoA-transferase CaiB-like acyl-CoA transferase